MTSAESAELVELAEASGLVHCTNFNIRFYPMVQEARERVRAGELGRRLERPRRLPAGLARSTPTDWNWRLEPEKGGELRAVGDIGSHWLDLSQFVTGQRIVEVFADLATAIPVRQRPTGEVETFAAAADVEREDAPMSTEDIAHILLRFDGGARGSLVVSQVSTGRKNSLRFEVDGSAGALAWDGERHEELWLGHRDAPNEVLLRNPALMHPGGRAARRSSRSHTRRGSRTRFASSTAPSTRTSPAAGRPPRPTTRPSATATSRTCSATPSARSDRERHWVDGWR